MDYGKFIQTCRVLIFICFCFLVHFICAVLYVRIMCYSCVVNALASTGVSICVCMCLHKKDRNQHQIPLFICFYLYFLRNDILLNLKLIVLARLTGQ